MVHCVHAQFALHHQRRSLCCCFWMCVCCILIKITYLFKIRYARINVHSKISEFLYLKIALKICRVRPKSSHLRKLHPLRTNVFCTGRSVNEFKIVFICCVFF